MIVLAHRGLRSHGPENSLKGFIGVASAARSGIPIGVELDVRATADLQLAVVHNDHVLIDNDPDNDFYWMENWYESAVRLLGDDKPALLHEVLDIVQHDVPFIAVDIKERGYTELVVQAVKHVPRDRLSISAHIPDVVAEVRNLAPDIRTGMTVTKYFSGGNDGLVQLLHDVHADYLFPEHSLIDQELIDRLHDAGKEIAAYTVNDADKLQQLIDMGVDYPCTNNPEMAIAELRDHLADTG